MAAIFHLNTHGSFGKLCIIIDLYGKKTYLPESPHVFFLKHDLWHWITSLFCDMEVTVSAIYYFK